MARGTTNATLITTTAHPTDLAIKAWAGSAGAKSEQGRKTQRKVMNLESFKRLELLAMYRPADEESCHLTKHDTSGLLRTGTVPGWEEAPGGTLPGARATSLRAVAPRDAHHSGRYPRPLPASRPRRSAASLRGYLSPVIHQWDDKSPRRVSVPSFQTELRPHLGGGPAGEVSNRELTAPQERLFCFPFSSALPALTRRPWAADSPCPRRGRRRGAGSSSGERGSGGAVPCRAAPRRTSPGAGTLGGARRRRGAQALSSRLPRRQPQLPPSAAARAPLSCARR